MQKEYNRILLVEDEASVVKFIIKGLTEEEYKVSVAFNGESALQMVSESEFDCIILDIMLPDINGVELCKILRQRKIQAPILFLTALGTTENIAVGLNSGADDYLVKPFKFIELNARIGALIRRATRQEPDKTSSEVYTIADLVVDDTTKEVIRANTPVQLTATEFRLLLVLIRNKGKVLSRMQLLEEAWDINFNLGTNVVDVYINYLRKKIDSAYSDKLIHTVIGMGYVLKEK